MKVVKKYTWALKLFISWFLLGSLFLVMHWPFADQVLYAAAAVLAVFYPLRYLAKKNKQLLDHVKLLLAFSVSINIFFRNEHIIPHLIAVIFFSFWFFNEGLFYFKFKLQFWKNHQTESHILDENELSVPNKEYYRVADVFLAVNAWLCAIGFIFKIMHWPFASGIISFSLVALIITIWFKKFD